MTIADVLAEVVTVEPQDDGALTVPYEGTFASVRTVTIADGLEICSVTQMVAWDLPLTDDLRDRVADHARTTMLGTVTLVEQAGGGKADVVQRYNFPFGGLSARALQTLVLMVLSAGAEVRREVAE